MKIDDRYIDEALRQINIVNMQRKQLLDSLRQALIENNHSEILYYSRQLCGISDESNRILKSINSGTSE
jgi:hypothetical protein